jgi:hypothetical protein
MPPTPAELRSQAAFLLSQAAKLEKPLTAADVSRMYKARDYEGIEIARRDGRLNALLTPTIDPTKENNS